MRPLSLTLYRFGSFIEEQTFIFPSKPGLYFMQGRNEVQPRLAGNGSGKTSIWRALTWVVFGKDPRGLKAGEVANWDAPKGAFVRFSFEHEGHEYSITRTHNPNSWKLYLPEDVMGPEGYGSVIDLADKKEVGMVFQFFRLEFKAWLNTVLIAQDAPMFLDLGAQAKADLFGEVMNLELWDQAAAKASKKVSAQDLAIRELERSIAELEGRLDEVDRADHAGASEAFESQRKKRIDATAVEYEALLDQETQFEEDLKTALANEEPANERYREADRMLGVRDADQKKQAAHLMIERSKLAVLDSEVKRLQDDLAELDTGTCPICGTSGAHLNDGKAALIGRLTGKRMAAKDMYGHVKEAERKLAELEEKVSGAEETARQARERMQGGSLAVKLARNDLERVSQKLNRLEDEIDVVRNEQNPFERMHREQSNARRDIGGQLLGAKARHRDATERFEMLRFWVSGFKDIRLQEISSALTELEIEANSETANLGLIGWELLFDVDRETKAGGISRGFSVHVRSPHNDKPVPWDAWSGGEAQRLRVATQAGLANLNRARTGATIELEVWDEPTKGMSPPGVHDLLTALANRAQQEKRQIWVVDHRSHSFGGFDGEVTVVKDAKGSRIAEVSY